MTDLKEVNTTNEKLIIELRNELNETNLKLEKAISGSIKMASKEE